MTDKNVKNSQSPRASRSSTNDPEKHSRGEVQTTQREPSKSDFGEGQPDPFRHQKDRYSNKYA